MNFEYFLPGFDIRKSNLDQPVESSRSDQCIIKGIFPIGSRKDNNSFFATKTIHLH